MVLRPAKKPAAEDLGQTHPLICVKPEGTLDPIGTVTAASPEAMNCNLKLTLIARTSAPSQDTDSPADRVRKTYQTVKKPSNPAISKSSCLCRHKACRRHAPLGTACNKASTAQHTSTKRACNLPSVQPGEIRRTRMNDRMRIRVGHRRSKEATLTIITIVVIHAPVNITIEYAQLITTNAIIVYASVIPRVATNLTRPSCRRLSPRGGRSGACRLHAAQLSSDATRSVWVARDSSVHPVPLLNARHASCQSRHG